MLCLKITLDGVAASTKSDSVCSPADFLGVDGTSPGSQFSPYHLRDIDAMQGKELYEFLNYNNQGKYKTDVWRRAQRNPFNWEIDDSEMEIIEKANRLRSRWWWIDSRIRQSLDKLSTSLRDKLYNSQFFQDNVKDLTSLEKLTLGDAENLGLNKKEMRKIIYALYKPFGITRLDQGTPRGLFGSDPSRSSSSRQENTLPYYVEVIGSRFGATGDVLSKWRNQGPKKTIKKNR